MRVLDLGCGGRKTKGTLGLDVLRLEGVDVIADIDAGSLPFKDNSFDQVICSHVLEHVEDVPRTMNEIHRIMRPNGRVSIRVPYFASVDAFKDPTHKHFFTFKTVYYFIEGNAEFNLRYTSARFGLLGHDLVFKKKSGIGPFLARLNLRRYEKYYSRRFPASEIVSELQVLK